jgi:hypothetical protein
MTPSNRGAVHDAGLMELRDEVLMTKEFPTAQVLLVFAGEVVSHPPDEIICCDMTVPAGPWMEGRVGTDKESQLPNT